jgi:hypothetical protein
MSELLKIQPRIVGTELEEPQIEFAESWVTPERGRNLATPVFPPTIICHP